MNKIRSFTLIEMMLVIVIIGIMLSITLSISGSQTKMLRFKIARENFIANYNAFIIKAITTNSSDTELIFRKNDDGNGNNYDPITLSGAGASSIYFENMSQIGITTFNGQPNPIDHTLSFDPIQGSCVLNNGGPTITGGNIPLTVWYRDDITICGICYELSLSTCKLKQTPCVPAPTNC